MYFVALVAPEIINKQVFKWKTWFKEKYRCEAALRSPAHVTLVPPFWMRTELESKLIVSLIEFATVQKHFSLLLNNFSQFKPRVIFVDVAVNSLLQNLRAQLFQSLLITGEYPLKNDDRPFHPHVTLATRDLYKKDFYEAWEYFKEKEYSAEWEVQNISLLRHDKKNWDVIATSQFK
jgi:2'-5' RNA ligase